MVTRDLHLAHFLSMAFCPDLRYLLPGFPSPIPTQTAMDGQLFREACWSSRRGAILSPLGVQNPTLGSLHSAVLKVSEQFWFGASGTRDPRAKSGNRRWVTLGATQLFRSPVPSDAF